MRADALEFSADPVSQAAHSLVELIDRMLRDAFESEYVIEMDRPLLSVPDGTADALEAWPETADDAGASALFHLRRREALQR